MLINELFKKLVDSELLTEETKVELQTQFDAFLKESVDAAKKETEEKVRIELTEQFVADKEALIEALDTKAEEYLAKELAELKDDIEKFRDLETEYAAKIVEAKREMAITVKNDMSTLVETLDKFLEERLNEEFEELREDIEEVKKLEFGRRIFEAVQNEYARSYVNENETAVALQKATTEIKNTKRVLESQSKELNAIKRGNKLAVVLESLTGRPKEVMSAILANVPTEKLEETYKSYIGRVLHESVSEKVEESTEQKEVGQSPRVLAESKDNSTAGPATTKVVSGDKPVLENEKTQDIQENRLDESAKERLRKLGGIDY